MASNEPGATPSYHGGPLDVRAVRTHAPCRLCGRPSWLADDAGPVHACCLRWAAAAGRRRGVAATGGGGVTEVDACRFDRTVTAWAMREAVVRFSGHHTPGEAVEGVTGHRNGVTSHDDDGSER